MDRQYEFVFTHLKQDLPKQPVLTCREHGETLYLYLSISVEVVNATLIRQTKEGQKPILGEELSEGRKQDTRRSKRSHLHS